MRLISTVRRLRQHFWLSLSAALVLFALAFVLRYIFSVPLEAAPFITLFPAILISALIGGIRVGILVTLVSGVAAVYWFLPPYGSFVVRWPGGYVTMLFFAITSAIQLLVVEVVNRAIKVIETERDRSAVMFQELQHRVANNMQFVASLMRLQERAIASDPSAGAQLLADLRKRFETMSRIHRRLYDPSALSVPLTQYFESLCADILDASGAKNVVCVVEAQNASLDAQRLLTLSLLVTEAITNSVKHAFKDGRRGTVSIRFDHEAEQFAVTIRDNGPGLPENYQFENSPSLGFRIMKSLASQLGGEITFLGQDGLTTRLVFPASAKAA